MFTHFSPGNDAPAVVNEYVNGVDVAPLNGKVALPVKLALDPKHIDEDVPDMSEVGLPLTVKAPETLLVTVVPHAFVTIQ